MASALASGAARELDLVLRHRYGDEQAFAEIFQRYQPMVYNLAYRLSDNAQEAEDACQEVFLRVYRHLGKFRGQSSLKTWIYRVTLNHCRSRLGRRRLPLVPLAAAGNLEPRAPAAVADPEVRALARADRDRLAAGLRALPRRFREAVLLRDVEGLSYQEVAEVLAIRIGTVRSRIARGREQLRRLLAEP